MEQERNFMKFNLHTHTVRCNHAVGSEREYVEQAIKAGVKVLGFADHTPQIYGNSHHSGMRMNIRDAEGYVNVVNSLKEEYKDDITILLGFEVEYYPDCFERLCVALELG